MSMKHGTPRFYHWLSSGLPPKSIRARSFQYPGDRAHQPHVLAERGGLDLDPAKDWGHHPVVHRLPNGFEEQLPGLADPSAKQDPLRFQDGDEIHQSQADVGR